MFLIKDIKNNQKLITLAIYPYMAYAGDINLKKSMF